jgi:hypothetical protein
MPPALNRPPQHVGPACSKYVKLPADKKYHITAYEGTYSPRLHHMVSQQG